jgi:WD40 repeat protein
MPFKTGLIKPGINMKDRQTKPKKRKWLKWFAALLLLIIGFLTYYQLWYKSERVNSNIFKLQTVIPAHDSYIFSIKFSPDSNLLASGSVDSTIKIWNRENGTLVSSFKQPSGVTYLAYSADGSLIATGAYDGKLRLWNATEGILAKTFTGNEGTIWTIDLSPDGKIIAGAGEEKLVKLWDITSGQLLHTLAGHKLNIWDIKFSPDGSKIASASFDETVKIWDAATGKLLHDLTDHSEAIVSLAFSPDGKILASTSDDKTIKLWNTTDWKLIRSLKVPEHIQASAFSPDSKLLLTGGRDKPAIGELLQNFFGDSEYNKGVSMRLWDVASGTILQTFTEHANDVNDVSWSNDGKYIASGSSDKTIELWIFSGR